MYVDQQLNEFYQHNSSMVNADYNIHLLCNQMVKGPVYVDDDLVSHVLPKPPTDISNPDAITLNQSLDKFYYGTVHLLRTNTPTVRQIELDEDHSMMYMFYE